MKKTKRGTHWLDFFPGGVPAGIIFDSQVKDACAVSKLNPSDEGDLRKEIGSEFALIGLIAYFEGFCKNHASAILNICPTLVNELADHGREIKIRAVDIYTCQERLDTQFGSIILENIDLGTAKAINSFFYDMLGITPISASDAKHFHALLEDRHLIVHHGNVFTPKFSTQAFIKREMNRLFLDSLVVKTADVQRAAEFLHGSSLKIRTVSRRALASLVKKKQIRLAKPRRDALKYLDSAESQ